MLLQLLLQSIPKIWKANTCCINNLKTEIATYGEKMTATFIRTIVFSFSEACLSCLCSLFSLKWKINRRTIAENFKWKRITRVFHLPAVSLRQKMKSGRIWLFSNTSTSDSFLGKLSSTHPAQSSLSETSSSSICNIQPFKPDSSWSRVCWTGRNAKFQNNCGFLSHENFRIS